MDRDLERGGEVMLVLRGNGSRLLPLAEETVVNQGLIGINRGGISPVTTGTSRSCTPSLGSKECRLGIGVTVALAFASGSFLGITRILFGAFW